MRRESSLERTRGTVSAERRCRLSRPVVRSDHPTFNGEQEHNRSFVLTFSFSAEPVFIEAWLILQPKAVCTAEKKTVRGKRKDGG
jgi:hypothetical protein